MGVFKVGLIIDVLYELDDLDELDNLDVLDNLY